MNVLSYGWPTFPSFALLTGIASIEYIKIGRAMEAIYILPNLPFKNIKPDLLEQKLAAVILK